MIQLTDNLEINKPAPVDDRLGVFESTAEALAYTNEDRRYIGLTVIVDDGTGAVEYWFKDGVTNGDLEAKATGGGATPTLAEVLDEGNQADENIELLNDSEVRFGAGGGILLDNGSRLKEGTIDAELGGGKGIAQICAVGYEMKWEAGRLYIMNDGGTTIRESGYNFTNTPTVNDDVTKGYVVGSRWVLDNGDVYVCSDSTEGASVWTIQPDFVPYTGATEDVNLGTHDLYTNKVYLYDESNDNHGSIHYTDGDFHIEDADGHKLLVIEDGFMQLHLSDTIQSNLFTSNLTQTRDHYLPNQSGTIALTSDITKNAVGLGNVDNTSDVNKPISTATQTALNAKENTITAGTTAQYYRGDKTFQTLDKTAVGLGNVDNTSDANKAFTAAQITSGTFDKARIPKVITAVAIAGSAFTSGNTTAETIMSTLTIPANTLNVGDVVRISGFMTYTTAATKSLRVKFGTTTAGTAIYSPASLSASATSTQIELLAVVTGSTTLRFATNTVTGNTIYGNNTGALVSQTIDRTQPISFIITVAKTSGTDTVTCESAFLEIITS
jgi:hypothetical protein